MHFQYPTQFPGPLLTVGKKLNMNLKQFQTRICVHQARRQGELKGTRLNPWEMENGK